MQQRATHPAPRAVDPHLGSGLLRGSGAARIVAAGERDSGAATGVVRRTDGGSGVGLSPKTPF